MSRIFILDSSVFIGKLSIPDFDGCLYTTPSVVKEVKDVKSSMILEAERERGLKVVRPSKFFIKKIRNLISVTAENRRLSETDIEILALALELKSDRVCVVTDDWTIQNVCEEIGIEWRSFRRPGILKPLRWKLKCPVCGSTYDTSTNLKQCEVCGSELKLVKAATIEPRKYSKD